MQVPGGDLAGEVVEGDEGGAFAPGDHVFACTEGYKPDVPWGCYAEYVSVPAAHLAHIPQGTSFTEAAALGLTGVGGACRPSHAVAALPPAPANPGGASNTSSNWLVPV
jgi:NADPH:quinone reductase-like Zn-dependent oxidoreductase